MAGPFGDHGQHGFAQKVHSSVAQRVNPADGMANTHQTTESSGFGFDSPSEHYFGRNNLSVNSQYPATNLNWSWGLPEVDEIGVDTGGYTIEDGMLLNWEQNKESQPLGQSADSGRYALGSVIIVAVGLGVVYKGFAELMYDIACPRGNLSPAECYLFWNAGKLGPAAM